MRKWHTLKDLIPAPTPAPVPHAEFDFAPEAAPAPRPEMEVARRSGWPCHPNRTSDYAASGSTDDPLGSDPAATVAVLADLGLGCDEIAAYHGVAPTRVAALLKERGGSPAA